MMTLHENKPLFKKLVRNVAKAMHVKEHLIEKDYWVTYAVKLLFSSQISDKIVFKGGTSLSKCYQAIRRFSEDIDICLANCENRARAFRRRTMKHITKQVSQRLPEIEMPETRKEEIIRTTCHRYARTFPANSLGQVKEYIKLEVTQMGSYEPFETHLMQSYIADYLEELGDKATIQQYNLAAFSVRVLGLARTFAEKVSCLIQYSQALDPYKALGVRIRHMFDLHQLLKRKEMQAYITSPFFGEMLAKVKEEEQKNYRNNNLWLAAHPAEVLLFAQPLATLKKISSLSKESFGEMLVNARMPSDEIIAESLSQIHKALQTIEWYSRQEKEAGWVDHMYRKMAVYLPYDGVYNAIVVAQDKTSIEDNKQQKTLYIFPADSQERRLSQLVALAKRDQLPLQIATGYKTAYPMQYQLIQKLAVEYQVELK